LGWRAIYAPAASAYHVRSVIPGHRLAVPAVLNMHSVKNRFLMRVKNMTSGLYRRCWLRVTARDAVVLAACLICEQSSLPALWQAAKCLPRALRRRREIMRRRRISDDALALWFHGQPSFPLADVDAQTELDRLAV
jgi:hypothetical protein